MLHAVDTLKSLRPSVGKLTQSPLLAILSRFRPPLFNTDPSILESTTVPNETKRTEPRKIPRLTDESSPARRRGGGYEGIVSLSLGSLHMPKRTL